MHRAGRRPMLPSSIQNVHSGSGTRISALANTLSPSLVLMPSMWSGWKCEIRIDVDCARRDAGGGEIGVHEAGAVGDLTGGAGIDQHQF